MSAETHREALLHAAHEIGNAALPALMTARRLPESPERDRIIRGLERVMAEHTRITAHLDATTGEGG